MDPSSIFSATITEADEKLTAAAHGCDWDRRIHPVAGPSGEELATTIVRRGPAGARNALVILSGVHGVEGFAGAALQCGLLLDPSAVTLPDETALVLVHLVNPWGMAWNRREDHENVDVFRNLLYHEAPIEPDPLFDEIDDALDLPSWTDPARSDAKRRALVERYGLPRVVAAVRRGQHHRPKSLTYHGSGACWSTRMMEEAVDRALAGVRQVALIDVHTGFGAPGAALVMSYEHVGSAKHDRAHGWIGADLYSPGSDFNIPPHPVAPYRFIEARIPGLEVMALILEFGTEPAEVTRDLFPANAHYHLYGNPRSAAAVQVGVRYRRFCYPERDRWKRAVWSGGLEVVNRVSAGLASWSRER